MKETLDRILTHAFQLKASDIHFTVGVPPLIRLHGSLKRYGKERLMPKDTEEMARAMLEGEKWEEFKEVGEIDFSYGVKDISRFRVNAYHQRSSIGIAVRVIPTKIPSLEELNMPTVLEKLVKRPQGLILVTGPTGSGKSTTLASMIDYLNRHISKHVITLEDPIEYLHRHQLCMINQREIGFDTQTFANGLRASLRQDPDVILVGEMRDLETISTAITAAETGHLVLATLHTSSATATIDRIIDVFPPHQQDQVRIQLASVLLAVLSQRLFPTADGKGRRAGTELLIGNSAVSNLIRNKKTYQIQSIMQTNRASGMHTMENSVLDLLKQGMITKEVAEPYLQELKA
ncbi:MAG TPA: type IV pilus twitching motility protein PilT [Massilibacterium sp.]|nr:type IV pilus twitching motility protein PilT [Massilibacterium sp.]